MEPGLCFSAYKSLSTWVLTLSDPKHDWRWKLHERYHCKCRSVSGQLVLDRAPGPFNCAFQEAKVFEYGNLVVMSSISTLDNTCASRFTFMAIAFEWGRRCEIPRHDFEDLMTFSRDCNSSIFISVSPALQTNPSRIQAPNPNKSSRKPINPHGSIRGRLPSSGHQRLDIPNT